MFIKLLKDFMGNAPGKQLHVSDTQARLLVQQGIAEAVTDDPVAPLIAQSIDQVTNRLTQSLDSIITTALKQFQEAQSQARKNSGPLIFGGDGASTLGHNPKHCFGDWLLHVARQDDSYLEKEYRSFRTKSALAENSGVTGGYIVPPEFAQQLLSTAAEENFIRPRAYVQPMGSATLQFPYLDVTTVQTAGTSPFFGGVVLNWTEEAQTRTETEPQFKMLELKAHELSGYAVSSNILLQDANFGLEKFLYTIFGKAIGWYEEFAFLQGNGVGKPLGILNAAPTIAVTRAGGGLVQFADVAGMWAKLLPVSWSKAIWTFSPSVVPQLLQLKDGANRAIFISIDQGATKSPNWALLGRPAFPTEKVPALGTKGDVMLIDPSFYVIGDRMQIEIAASEHVNFLKNQMTWRVVERVDGQPWLDKAITLQDGSTTVSPFVALN
jgi:HK97 family phage major capsid protein